MTMHNDKAAMWRIDGASVFEAGRGPVSVGRHVLTEDVQAHDHDFLEIVLISGGSATHQTIYGPRTIGRGDLIVIRPSTWHAYRDCRRTVVWNCCLMPELLGRPPRWADSKGELDQLLWTGAMPQQTRGLMETRLNESQTRQMLKCLKALSSADTGTLEVVGRIYLLFDLIVRALGDAAGQTTDALHPAVRRAVALMRSRIEHDWSLDELARHARLDRSYLVRLFRKQLDASPIELLIRWRCERAAGLLLSTDKSAAEVGYEVGWDDPSYFARRFGMHFGQSPTAYRRVMR